MSESDLHAEVPHLSEAERRALDSAEHWVGGDVNGVGIGATAQGEPCVVVFVRTRESASVTALPERIEGLPVLIEVGEEFRTQN